MKKSLKTQLAAAIAMMVVAAIALTSVGYAWFTAIANPTVEDMDVYVKAADSMFLSELTTPIISTPADWKTTVLKSDIITTQPTSFQTALGDPKQLSDVSSVFALGNNGFYKAEFDGTTGAINNFDVAEADAYVSFKLWAKSTNSGYVYINANSAVNAIKALLSVDPTGAAYDGPIDPVTKEFIKGTVRVGFVPIDYVAATGGAVVAPGTGTLDWANAVIWEPNSEDHLGATYEGEATSGKNVISAVKEATVIPGGPFTSVAAHTLEQLTFDFIADETNLSAGTNVSGDATDAANRIALFNLRADRMQQFAVYIWVEGQDGDTKNAVAKSNFVTLLQFGQEKDSWISTTAATGEKTLGAVPVI